MDALAMYEQCATPHRLGMDQTRMTYFAQESDSVCTFFQYTHRCCHFLLRRTLSGCSVQCQPVFCGLRCNPILNTAKEIAVPVSSILLRFNCIGTIGMLRT